MPEDADEIPPMIAYEKLALILDLDDEAEG